LVKSIKSMDYKKDTAFAKEFDKNIWMQNVLFSYSMQWKCIYCSTADIKFNHRRFLENISFLCWWWK
jgi:hypothetical protein